MAIELCMSGHLYWDMGHPFFKVIVEDLWQLLHLAVELSLHVPVLTILWTVVTNWLELHPIFCMQGELRYNERQVFCRKSTLYYQFVSKIVKFFYLVSSKDAVRWKYLKYGISMYKIGNLIYILSRVHYIFQWWFHKRKGHIHSEIYLKCMTVHTIMTMNIKISTVRDGYCLP